jgi:LTXXQ motif family protein
MSNPVVVTALALVMTVTALRTSTAQTNDQTGTNMNISGGGCPLMGIMSQGTMAGLQAGMMAMVDGRLADLKEKLKITVPQTEAWDDYARAARSQATVLQGVQNAMTDVIQNGTAIKRMDVRIRSMKLSITHNLHADRNAEFDIREA